MARIRIGQDDLITALEEHSYECYYVLDLTNGEVHWVPTELSGLDRDEELEAQMEAEPERFRKVQSLPSRVGFAIMEEFADSLPDSRMKDRLFHALHGRRPFRHFKDVLNDDEQVSDAFFRFRDQEMLIHAQEWLDEEGLDAELVPYSAVKELL